MYKAFELTNGIKVLVISDSNTDKSSATVDVRVGSYWDVIQGEAHFLEHMLFMGTEKYPDENEYSRYLHAHGGYSNAYTDKENTNFHFEVSTDHFEGALDRLSQFFVSPLLKEDSVDRERQAVNSEHSMHLQSDMWRQHQLVKEVADPQHPYSRFHTGNAETLNIDGIRDKLWDFYKQHYSANRMALVVLGKETVDVLQTWVETYFSSVPNLDLDKVEFPGNPFASRLPKRFLVFPVEPHITVDLMFPIREVETLYRSKPLNYLSHLLGHESAGSILAWLKQHQWAHELSAGQAASCSDWSGFTVQVTLTELGFENLDRVVQVVFAYLNMLRQLGPQKWVHDETATVADCSFRFISRREPMDYTSGLARNLHDYPANLVLSGAYKIYDYEPGAITEILECLTPSNLLMTVSNPAFEGQTKTTEKWYGTNYSLEDIEPETLEQWSAASIDDDWLQTPGLSLPERNDMIATDFSLKKVESVPNDEPTLLRDTPTCRLWFKPDNVFDMPKVNWLGQFRTVVAYESPKATVMTSLWQLVVLELANEYLYLASMAGLNGNVQASQTGFELQVSGYNHKIHRLLERMVETIRSVPEQLTQDVFDRLHDKHDKRLQHFLVAQPYHHAMYGSDVLLVATKWTVEQKMEALKQIRMEDLVEFSRTLVQSFQLEALVHGNVLPDEANQLVDIVLNSFNPSPPAELPVKQVVALEPGPEYIYRFDEFNPQNTNSCVSNIYLVGPTDLKTNSVVALVSHLMQEPAFQDLRTEQQLGYTVFTSVHTAGDHVKGIFVLVQSDSHDPNDLNERMEAFVNKFYDETLSNMSDEDFDMQVQAVSSRFREKNKNLTEESVKHWLAITRQDYLFKRHAQIADLVETLSKDEVLNFYKTYVMKGDKRVKVSVQTVATNHKDGMPEAVKEGVVLVTSDVAEFKCTKSCYPGLAVVDVSKWQIENYT